MAKVQIEDTAFLTLLLEKHRLAITALQPDKKAIKVTDRLKNLIDDYNAETRQPVHPSAYGIWVDESHYLKPGALTYGRSPADLFYSDGLTRNKLLAQKRALEDLACYGFAAWYEPPPFKVPAWEKEKAYKDGDLVSFEGKIYRQRHGYGSGIPACVNPSKEQCRAAKVGSSPRWELFKVGPSVTVPPGTTIYDWRSGWTYPARAIVRFEGQLYQQRKDFEHLPSAFNPGETPLRWEPYPTPAPAPTPAPPQWKSNEKYGQGDKVTFDGKVYRQKHGWPIGQDQKAVKSLVVPSEAVNRWELLTG